MKQLSTTVKTGDILLTKEGRQVRIGLYHDRTITLHTQISPTSSITERVSTRELNKRLRDGRLIAQTE